MRTIVCGRKHAAVSLLLAHRLPDLAARDVSTKAAGQLLCALKACGSIGDVELGRKLHCDAAHDAIVTGIHVANTLLSMYARCGSPADARAVFVAIPRPDLVSWNALVLGLAINAGYQAEALHLVEELMPACDARTFVAAMVACASLAARQGDRDGLELLDRAMALHSRALSSGNMDLFVANSAVDMYTKCGSLLDSRMVFDRMPCHSLVSWNSLISACVDNEEAELGLQLFHTVSDHGWEPNARTFVAALSCCSSLISKQGSTPGEPNVVCWKEEVAKIHSQAAGTGCDSQLFVANCLIDVYASCGSLLEARAVFNKMQVRSVVSWTALLFGYVHNGESRAGLELFSRMQAQGSVTPNACTFVAALMAVSALAEEEAGKLVRGRLVKVSSLEYGMGLHSQLCKDAAAVTDIYVGNSILVMYTKCGSMLDARCVFDTISTWDTASWNSLLLGYAENGEAELCLELFAAMKPSVVAIAPDARTLVAALVACGSLTSLQTGKFLHGEICRHGMERDVFLANSLIDLYSKCGSLANAEQVFDSTSTKNSVTWSSLIAGYCQAGDGNDGAAFALELLSLMRELGLEPNDVTFLSLLTGCSRAGLVNKGRQCFRAMISQHRIKPRIEHYHCMIDMLGRANRLEEAMSTLESMPFCATQVTWTIILAACHKWNNVELGTRAYHKLLDMDESQIAAYVLMSNIYGINARA
ncbi:putative pentatricopeptide repeat-containing protein At3g01580 [Selaginella moellendorffii]|uniref:putative pentatricopeptide repeat-containing protein At3g01580 n=1 Tax=Selaginella moellendorffii TaxID=88036 RepID=UPI000D1C78EE|nr:putative pentatricopeptide repeat-containing protein At3g01580 [Selaginella moellendorffii]|eukprot:XP_024545865.1 putative pentatricopeptide repeat-containing protein At3g01580 [Selaginella moellendorffii]